MNRTVVLSALFVLATACANVLQKRAMQSLSGAASWTAGDFGRLAASPYLWAGLACWGISLAAYLVILSRVPLNVATSIASLNFVTVLLASRLVLGEAIPPLRVLGFAFILLGMTIVAFTQRGGP